VSWSNYIKYFPLEVWLVWHVLLGIGVVCRHASSVWRWARPGPAASNCSDEESYGSCIDKPPSVLWLNSTASLLPQFLSGEASLVRVLSKRNLKVVFPEKKIKWCALFRRKRALTEYSPEFFAIWNKKLEGLESSELKKLKIFPEDIYPVALEPLSGFFYEKNLNEGSFWSLLR
jgi:hypothetical protein